MESIQDNHDRCVFELSLVMHLQFQTLICHRPLTKFLNFGWPLNRGKDNNETLIGTTNGDRGGNRSIGVLFTIFY